MRILTLGLKDVKRIGSIHILVESSSGKSSSDVIAVATLVPVTAPSEDSVERLDEIRPYIRRG